MSELGLGGDLEADLGCKGLNIWTLGIIEWLSYVGCERKENAVGVPPSFRFTYLFGRDLFSWNNSDISNVY